MHTHAHTMLCNKLTPHSVSLDTSSFNVSTSTVYIDECLTFINATVSELNAQTACFQNNTIIERFKKPNT